MIKLPQFLVIYVRKLDYFALARIFLFLGPENHLEIKSRVNEKIFELNRLFPLEKNCLFFLNAFSFKKTPFPLETIAFSFRKSKNLVTQKVVFP